MSEPHSSPFGAAHVLPLDNDSGFNRSISISSTRINANLIQVRGELIDTRQDFEDPKKTILVHNIVARITFQLSDNIITAAEFGLPKMAFEGMCEKLPTSADELVGLNIFKGLSFKIRALYSGPRSCFHLSSLLQAMLPACSQARCWNNDFKEMDEKLPANLVPQAMDTMYKSVKNSCHAWSAKGGGITKDFDAGNYGPMLERTSPRLLGRWKQEDSE